MEGERENEQKRSGPRKARQSQKEGGAGESVAGGESVDAQQEVAAGSFVEWSEPSETCGREGNGRRVGGTTQERANSSEKDGVKKQGIQGSRSGQEGGKNTTKGSEQKVGGQRHQAEKWKRGRMAARSQKVKCGAEKGTHETRRAWRQRRCAITVRCVVCICIVHCVS